MVLLEDLETIKSPILNHIVEVSRKIYGPKDDKQLIDLFRASSISVPLQPNTTIRITGFRHGSLYNYRSKGDSPNTIPMQLLLQFHASLRPNKLIMNLVHMLRQQLSKEYVAVHLRLEGDTVRTMDDFVKEVEIVLQKVIASDCYKAYGVNHSTARWYFASGVFLPLGVNGTSQDQSRKMHLLERLKHYGFQHIMNRNKLQLELEKRESSPELLNLLHHLTIEQQAFVDFNLVRRSICFVPSHKESSFSYMVMRMNQLDTGATEVYKIAPPNDGFYEWGF